MYYTLKYHRRIESRWLIGRIRNLTMIEALRYSNTMKDLLGEKTMIIIARDKGQ